MTESKVQQQTEQSHAKYRDRGFSKYWAEIDELVVKIKKDWKRVHIDRLLEIHDPLFRRACIQYERLDSQEVYETAQEVLVELVRVFDPKRNVYFNTFIQNAFWWALQSRLHIRTPTIDKIEKITTHQDDTEVTEVYELVRKSQGEKNGDIFLLIVKFGLCQDDIAILFEVSQSAISSRWRRIRNYLRGVLKT